MKTKPYDFLGKEIRIGDTILFIADGRFHKAAVVDIKQDLWCRIRGWYAEALCKFESKSWSGVFGLQRPENCIIIDRAATGEICDELKMKAGMRV